MMSLWGNIVNIFNRIHIDFTLFSFLISVRRKHLCITVCSFTTKRRNSVALFYLTFDDLGFDWDLFFTHFIRNYIK